MTGKLSQTGRTLVEAKRKAREAHGLWHSSEALAHATYEKWVKADKVVKAADQAHQEAKKLGSEAHRS